MFFLPVLPKFARILRGEIVKRSGSSDSGEPKSETYFDDGGSSNGRTADSGSAYRGSNPCPPASICTLGDSVLSKSPCFPSKEPF